MNVNVYEKQIDYLRSRTDMVNSALESALIPTLSKTGTNRRVREYIFDGEYVLANNPAWRLVFKTERLFYKKNGRVKTKIKDTISFALKPNETMYDLSKTYGLSIDMLIRLNPNVPVDNMVNGEVKDFTNHIIHTDISANIENLHKFGIINKFLTFVDGHYISMNDVYIESDIDNDYIIVNINNLKDWSGIKDYTKLDLMYYEDATEDSGKGFGKPIFTFDDKGELNDAGKTKVWSTDPNLYHFEFFEDSTLGLMLNERLKPFTFRQKIKPQNIMCFQDGSLIPNVPITVHNGNIVNVMFPEFKVKSKIVVFYNTRIEYTQDNILRFSKDKLEEIADTYEMYLDMLENSCQRFIDEIYRLNESDPDGEKYGFMFEDVRINGLEEPSNSVDTLIFYNKPFTKNILTHLVKEIFEHDSETVRNILFNIVNDAKYNDESLKNVKFEWNLRKNLPEMFKYTPPPELPFLDDYSVLDDSFNFSHNDNQTYEKNLLDAIKYISEYDSDKLERGLPRNIYTLSYKGDEVRRFIGDDGKLYMGRYNCNANHRRNYVMIFKNGELLSTYNTIQYDNLSFSVDMPDFLDEDTFDFVFFLFCNNVVFPMSCNDSMLQSISVYTHNEVDLFNKTIRDNKYNPFGSRVFYRIPFTIDLPYIIGESSEPTPPAMKPGIILKPGVVFHFDDNDLSVDNFIYITTDKTLAVVTNIIDNYISDPEMNEIFHQMAINARNKDTINDELALREHLSDTLSSENGVVDTVIQEILALQDISQPSLPEQSGSTGYILVDDKELYKLKLADEDLNAYSGEMMIVCSKRQFRYYHTKISNNDTKYIKLGEDFDYCPNKEQYLVFVNNRLLPRSYIVATPLKDTPVNEHRIYFNVDLKENDTVDVFYVAEPMFNDFNPEIRLKSDNTTSGYIRINKSEALVGINKDSALVFVNGKKISYSDIYNVSNNTIKILDTSVSKESMTLSLDIYRYLQSNENITLREYTPSKLDKMIPVTTEKTDDAMNIVGKEPMGNEDEFFEPYDKDTILNLLYEDYLSSSLDDSWIAFF